MSQSKYQYVKHFEPNHLLLPNTWIVIRLDGKNFHKFSNLNKFTKPNDSKALALMNYAATNVMNDMNDLTLAYGQSDEYSFLFRRSTSLYNRREMKLASVIGSLFTAYYVMGWPTYFPSTTKPVCVPSFDARAIAYPTIENVRDYFAWRQSDCHINNLYNTTFWALVLQGQLSENQAHIKLKKTLAKDKNEILFSQFNINYNNEPEQFRKGTTLYKQLISIQKESSVPLEHADPQWPTLHTIGDHVVQMITRQQSVVRETTQDIIAPDFWDKYPQAISN